MSLKPFRKKLFAAAGYNTTYFGPGRREFDPKQAMPPFESYLKESADGTLGQIPRPKFDEGIIGSFMSGQFLKQGNLPGFLPFMVPSLLKKPCTGIEGACGTGGRCIAAAAASVLSDQAEAVFVAAFEIQNTLKSVYGADVLAAAGYYRKERKKGYAFFFPGVFSDRAEAYSKRWGADKTRQAMAKWYEQSILNARKNPKAQEYHNRSERLFSLGMTPPDPESFLPYLNLYDCSKISDGASSIVIASERGLETLGIPREEAVELVAISGAEGDITKEPEDPAFLDTTREAVSKALSQAGISLGEIAFVELHDCFTITALLSLEAIGAVEPGGGSEFILQEETRPGGSLPANLSGGLIGFGHPTGASGVRQLVDLHSQFIGKAAHQLELKKEFAMLVSMGGNDKTVTSVIARK